MRPMYSPMIPKNMSWIPPSSNTVMSVVACPAKAWFPARRSMAMIMIVGADNPAMIKPSQVASCSGM